MAHSGEFGVETDKFDLLHLLIRITTGKTDKLTVSQSKRVTF